MDDDVPAASRTRAVKVAIGSVWPVADTLRPWLIKEKTSMRLYLIILLFIVGSSYGQTELQPGSRDGQVHELESGKFVAWDAHDEQWLGTEAFWASFAARERGRAWPSGTQFPPYAEVNEHDTFLYRLDSGPCLMYFFHTRWRRANDVWRWADEFNEYGGCPHVFD